MALKSSLKNTIERSSDEDMKAWDNIQQKLMCCGVDSPTDWREISKNHVLRPSCCVKKAIDSTGDCRNADYTGKDKYYQVIWILSLPEANDNLITIHAITGRLHRKAKGENRQKRSYINRCRNWYRLHTNPRNCVGMLLG